MECTPTCYMSYKTVHNTPLRVLLCGFTCFYPFAHGSILSIGFSTLHRLFLLLFCKKLWL